jgi:Zn-dependent protease/CBS domain-containing protein
VSLRYGLEVRQIILFVFGGIADIKDETKEYKKEFRIAVVGPLASFGLALVFLLSWYLIFLLVGNDALPSILSTNFVNMDETFDSGNLQDSDSTSTIASILSGILIYSIVVNILVGAFNLLPAFPLDGGRMLCALLVKWNMSYDKATKTAVNIGTGISFGLMAYGFITIFTGSAIGGFWFLIIGWFLQSAAQTYLQQHEISRNLVGLQLKDIRITDFIYVNSNQTVGPVVQNYFNVYRKSEFPVLDEEGYLVGSITNKQINTISLDKPHDIKVTEIMTPINDLVIMDKNDRADEALRQLYQGNKNRAHVGTGYSKNKMFNGLIKNKRVINKKSDEIQPLSPKSSLLLGYNQSIKVKLEGIVSKTDLLNIARKDDKFKENPTN